MKKLKRQNLTAIIYDKRGRVISIGKNSYEKTHPSMLYFGRLVGQLKRPYLHAEISAITRCAQLDRAYLIEVYRINSKGEYVSSCPCEICASAISRTNIRYVKFFDIHNELKVVTVEELLSLHNLS